MENTKAVIVLFTCNNFTILKLTNKCIFLSGNTTARELVYMFCKEENRRKWIFIMLSPVQYFFKLIFKQLGSILNALDFLTPLKIYFRYKQWLFGLPRWLSVKEASCDEGDLGLTPGSGRSPGEGNGNSLQYSCLGNFMDRGAWWTTGHGVTKELDMT